MGETIRPTKKQRELLAFIEGFIAEHGYSPSYREIMNGLNYTSVATVALHINNLIKRGHLRKRDHSARSLEVAGPTAASKLTSNEVSPAEEKWLVGKVDHFLTQAEQSNPPSSDQINQMEVLLATLRILGLEAAALSFAPRLVELKRQAK